MPVEHHLVASVTALEDWSAAGSQEQLARAEAVVAEATDLGRPELAMRAQVVAADMHMRLGQITAAKRSAEEVGRWARDNQSPLMLACSHRVLAGATQMAGDSAGSLVHAVAAVELLDEDAPPVVRGRHLQMLAGALGFNRAFDLARERYLQAEQVFIGCGCTDRLLHVLNNLACLDFEAGHPERAYEAAERLLRLIGQHGAPLAGPFVDTIARARMGTGRYAEAEAILVGALTSEPEVGPDVSTGAEMMCELLLTLAELRRLQGRTQEAQQALDDSTGWCAASDLEEIAVRIQREQSMLHASNGRWEEAFTCLQGAWVAADALTTAQGAEAAATRHALLQVAEARDEAETYRQQTLRDPLTGMRNRRFLDGTLPRLLLESARDGATTVVAIIDVDHFKQVNDTHSHHVGDQVLVRIAGILVSASRRDRALSSDSFAARIGGEEFVLVLDHTDATFAASLLEEVRSAVQGGPWHEVAPGLRLTVSIGAVTAEADEDQSALLRAADSCLYRAKHAGRNLVVLRS